MFEHFFDAVDVIAVADHDAGLEIHTAHDFGDGGGAVDGGVSFAFDDDVFGADAVGGKIGAADSAFGEDRVAAGASGSDNERRHVTEIEKKGVIETGFQNGRRTAAILGGAEYDDGVGGACFIDLGLALDGGGHPAEIVADDEGGGGEDKQRGHCKNAFHDAGVRRGSRGEHSSLRSSYG